MANRPRGELIVIARPAAKVRADRTGAPIAEEANVHPLAAAFARPEVNLVPLFGLPEEQIRRDLAPRAAMTEDSEHPARDLSSFYRVDCPGERMREIAEQIRQSEAFEAAYIKPFTELPFFQTAAPARDDPPLVTPDYLPRQGYLHQAPGGIDVVHARTFDGGDGRGVGIIDIEGAWRFTHENLKQLGGIVGGGVPFPDLNWRNHGTAVLGIMGGAGNGRGVSGICPAATIRAISYGGPDQSTSKAIQQAAELLAPGDIILLEAHRPGPQSPTPFLPNDPQQGYIAVEWWPDDYAAIAYAVSKGIIVVGAAGNGAVNLDDPIYDRNPDADGSFGPFPSWWENPFRRNRLNSGVILVGAGAPPSGAYGPDRSRLDFSNHGMPVDAQGWGREVVTTGYGDLQGPILFEDLWYTHTFAGTSSASPIVVGALACLQGALKAAGRPPLTSTQARELLRSTGTPQVRRHGQKTLERIGTRPDLQQLLAAVGLDPQPKIKVPTDPVVVDKKPDTSNSGEPDQPEPRQTEAGDEQPKVETSLTNRVALLEARLDKLAQFIGVNF